MGFVGVGCWLHAKEGRAEHTVTPFVGSVDARKICHRALTHQEEAYVMQNTTLANALKRLQAAMELSTAA